MLSNPAISSENEVKRWMIGFNLLRFQIDYLESWSLVLSDNFLINHQQIKIREEAERKEN